MVSLWDHVENAVKLTVLCVMHHYFCMCGAQLVLQL